jgi:ABC-type oligopeptide transport system substrate-binding subunit
MIVAGWYADYPDPENFLFLLYGPYHRPEGSNTANYANPEFDRLFGQMRAMDDTPERRKVIDEMRAVAVEDCPWVYLYHRQSVNLIQRWYHNVKPHPVANDIYKYRRVDIGERESTRLAWNRPDYLPAILLGVFLIAGSAPAVASVRRRRAARGRRGD